MRRIGERQNDKFGVMWHRCVGRCGDRGFGCLVSSLRRHGRHTGIPAKMGSLPA
jgi:hypothetical protein